MMMGGGERRRRQGARRQRRTSFHALCHCYTRVPGYVGPQPRLEHPAVALTMLVALVRVILWLVRPLLYSRPSLPSRLPSLPPKPQEEAARLPCAPHSLVAAPGTPPFSEQVSHAADGVVGWVGWLVSFLPCCVSQGRRVVKCGHPSLPPSLPPSRLSPPPPTTTQSGTFLAAPSASAVDSSHAQEQGEGRQKSASREERE